MTFLSIFQSTSVRCDVIVLLSIYDFIQITKFLGHRWRMRKQSIPGPSSVRPGIEVRLGLLETEYAASQFRVIVQVGGAIFPLLEIICQLGQI